MGGGGTHIRLLFWSPHPLPIYWRNLAMKIFNQIPLSKYTTLKLGGPAAFFISITTVSELKKVLSWADKSKKPFIVIGGGSNILFPDKGWSGLVIHMNIKGIHYERSGTKTYAIVGAGENWDEFVQDSIKKNLWGLENLSAIPGSVGASPVQNIGAYGAEVSKSIEWVEVYNSLAGKIERLTSKECSFGYRHSLFKTPAGNGLIVTAVCFSLSTRPYINLLYKDLSIYFKTSKIKPTLLSVREAVVSIRRQKFPDLHVVGTAGSFFKNPIVNASDSKRLKKKYPKLPMFLLPDGQTKLSLAWILDNVLCLNGIRDGNIGIFKHQPLVLVNYGEASSQELVFFAERIMKQVREEVGVVITPEVHVVTQKK